MQTLGGMGYATEYHVERYFREARRDAHRAGEPEMTLNYVAQQVLGLPRSCSVPCQASVPSAVATAATLGWQPTQPSLLKTSRTFSPKSCQDPG